VQVFRFITEGTVEEKIIERAERKLFLDAAVVQQGRLAEQHSSLEKDELMKMVRFGADQILSGKGGTYTDEDIDALIARGEEKTSQMQAKLKTDVKHNLADFSLLADDDGGTDTFSFGGKNYRDAEKGSVGNFINLPQRQRKRVYDLYALENQVIPTKKSDAGTKKKRKGPAVYDFQLFNIDRLNELLKKERSTASKKVAEIRLIAELRQQAVHAPTFGSGVAPGRSREELLQQAEHKEKQLDEFQLSEEEKQEKDKIMAEGFPDWSRKDFKIFCASLERHGRYEFAAICEDVMNETGKDRQEIQRYFVAFWTCYQRIAEWPKILERIERGEKKKVRLRLIRDAIQEKVERHLVETFGPHYGVEAKSKNEMPIPSVAEMLHCSWPKMKINYGSNRGKGYQEEEDAFLVCMMYRHGYGAAERIRMEIRRAWQFRFDWFFKSRSAQEIQRRCDALVKVIERENEDIRKKEEVEEKEKLNKSASDSHAMVVENDTIETVPS
jgi:SWI/SNF-related matrix-associated actin-dependent regulator of chromatin subfamily A member 5